MIQEQDRNGIIIAYEVMHGYAGNFTLLNSTRNELLLSNLDQVQEYSIRVRGYTSVGGGPYSEVVTETTQEDSKWFKYKVSLTSIFLAPSVSCINYDPI